MTSSTNHHKRCGEVSVEFLKVSGHQVLQLEVHSRATLTDPKLGRQAADVEEQQRLKQEVFSLMKPIIKKYVETTQKKRKHRHNAAAHVENNVASRKPDTLSIIKGDNVRLGYLFKPSAVGHTCLLSGKQKQRYVGFTLLPQRLVVYFCPYKNPLLNVKSSGYFQTVEQSAIQPPLQHKLKNIVQKSGPKLSRLNGWRKPSTSTNAGPLSKDVHPGGVVSISDQGSAALRVDHTVKPIEEIEKDRGVSLGSKKMEDLNLAGGSAESKNPPQEADLATEKPCHNVKRKKIFIFKKAAIPLSSQSSQSEESGAESMGAKNTAEVPSVPADVPCSTLDIGRQGSHLKQTAELTSACDIEDSKYRDTRVASKHCNKSGLSKHCDKSGTSGASKHCDKSTSNGANKSCDKSGSKVLNSKHLRSSQGLKLAASYQGTKKKSSQLECGGKTVKDGLHLDISSRKRKLAPDLSNLLSDSASDEEFHAASSIKVMKKKDSAKSKSVKNIKIMDCSVVIDKCTINQEKQDGKKTLKPLKNCLGLNKSLKLGNKQTTTIPDGKSAICNDQPESIYSCDEDTLLGAQDANEKCRISNCGMGSRQAQLRRPTSWAEDNSNDSDSVIMIERRPSREDAMKSSLQGIKNLSELTPQQVKWLVESNEDYLRQIFQGKRSCRRHEDYKKGGQAKAELKFQIPMGSFVEEQDDQIMQLLLKMFCNRHDKYSDYVMKVMLAEIRIKIGMDVYGTTYEQAEQRMNSMDCSQDSMSLSRAFAVLRNPGDDTGISSE